jgi:hypothetical protein
LHISAGKWKSLVDTDDNWLCAARFSARKGHHMLAAIKDNGTVERISKQPHERQFRQWMRNLAPADFQRSKDALNEYINTTGRGEIITTSWIPGSDWTGTPYQPIYEAVGEDWEMARFFFGLIVWNVMMDRPEPWSFGRYPRHEGEIIGLTYFRVSLN